MTEELFQGRRLRSFQPEKIVLLIDNHNYVKSNCQEWNNNNNILNDDNDSSTILDCIKSYLHVFIQRKLRTAMKHEIAIISFDENNVYGIFTRIGLNTGFLILLTNSICANIGRA